MSCGDPIPGFFENWVSSPLSGEIAQVPQQYYSSMPNILSIPVPVAPIRTNSPVHHHDILKLDVAIQQHRRLYSDDLRLMHGTNGDVLRNLVRNRILVSLPETVYAAELMRQYADWLDSHNSGLYCLDAAERNNIMVSFEIEADMAQFILAFK